MQMIKGRMLSKDMISLVPVKKLLPVSSLWLLAMILGTSGCQSVTSSQSPSLDTAKQESYLGRTPVIGINDTLHVLDYTFGDEMPKTLFTITPVSVVEDSRCPINARCIQAGQLVVDVRMGQADTSSNIKVTSNPSQKTRWQGYELTIDQVMPLAQTNQNISPMDYKVQFSIEKRQ